MKIPYVTVVTAIIFSVFYLPLADSTAADKHTHKTYNQRLTKSRAERGYTNNGTVIYNYQEIDSYDDSISGEDIGNVEVEKGSRVREIHNVVIVKDDVESKKKNLEIGKIKVETSGNIRKINNSVTIDGKIESSGDSMEIGTVQSKKGSQINSMHNNVEIDGNIDAQ